MNRPPFSMREDTGATYFSSQLGQGTDANNSMLSAMPTSTNLVVQGKRNGAQIATGAKATLLVGLIELGRRRLQRGTGLGACNRQPAQALSECSQRLSAPDPPPSSPEARALGCICDPVINRDGKGERDGGGVLCRLVMSVARARRDDAGRNGRIAIGRIAIGRGRFQSAPLLRSIAALYLRHVRGGSFRAARRTVTPSWMA
jgi:hypothetical protein